KIAFGAEEKLDLPWGYTIAHRPIPFVTMPYVGTLDSFLYALPMRLFGTSPTVFRFTNLLLAFAIFLLAYWIARREAGPWAAALTLGLLLVDVELVLHLPTGFGPILLQQLLVLSAIAALQQWWRTGGAPLFLLATAFLAFAFHEKLTFIWVLGSLAPAILLFKFKPTWKHLKWWYIPAALLLAITIVSPILYFAWAVPEVILGFGKASTKAPADWSKLLTDRIHVFDLMLRGNWTMEFTVGNSFNRSPALLALFFTGLLASAFTRQRLALTLYATAIGVWVWNLAFPDAGRMHHLLLMAPLWQLGAAIAIIATPKPVQLFSALLLLISAYDATRSYAQYTAQAKQTGGVNHYSDMTTRAKEFFDQNPSLEAVTTSWGIDRSLNILSGGRLNASEFYFDTLAPTLSPESTTRLSTLIQKDRQVWLVSSVMPIYQDQWQRVVTLAASLGKAPNKVAEFPSRNGRHSITAYRFDTPKPAPTNWQSQSGNKITLPANWQALRLTLSGIADQETESITIHWQDATGKDLYTDNRHLGWFPHIHQTSTFEFTPNYWPKTFTRQRTSAEPPTQVHIESSLIKAKITSTELALP
ncbi:MAG: hypothetical protein NTW74_19425, partial [Acidobacteria bacterium]|nr:hypothetical protein [Acidobacteriota bacterium]